MPDRNPTIVQDKDTVFRQYQKERGHKKKISGRILADFTKNRQKRGRKKFVYVGFLSGIFSPDRDDF